MKTLFFIMVVAGAAVYLVARPQMPENAVSGFFWEDEMAQTAQQVLDEVDAQIAGFNLQHEKAQQATLAKVHQRLDTLQNQVDALLQQQAAHDKKDSSVMPVKPEQTATFPDERKANTQVVDNPAPIREAHLQAIAERMQALSFAPLVEG
ncbi:hypothetical protein [Alteromonas sp. C1M14]|uniref:hypothetical protein n=1 Tax=Alteromonas sp. C1M14 TaxID=2841567 RepID=UPI001C092AF1|nr:hypothetical protein [Alteromonas sp. C1M14]MBU2978210.1 hypothetical protein [Alteromonas sp. C1M14]